MRVSDCFSITKPEIVLSIVIVNQGQANIGLRELKLHLLFWRETHFHPPRERLKGILLRKQIILIGLNYTRHGRRRLMCLPLKELRQAKSMHKLDVKIIVC